MRDNGLSPARRQAIIWTNAGIIVNSTLGKKLHLSCNQNTVICCEEIAFENVCKMAAICLSFNVLDNISWIYMAPHMFLFRSKSHKKIDRNFQWSSVSGKWCHSLQLDQLHAWKIIFRDVVFCIWRRLSVIWANSSINPTHTIDFYIITPIRTSECRCVVSEKRMLLRVTAFPWTGDIRKWYTYVEISQAVIEANDHKPHIWSSI